MTTRRVAVVTGSRAESGLLQPVLHAIDAHRALGLHVIVAGAHLLPPAETAAEVEAAWPVAARVPMQRAGATGRDADALALGAGVQGFAAALAELDPDWTLVLGDRIEAFAAASAASIGGRAVAHVHGGDRAEGIADEAMRHAISKLAHLHLAATATSAYRLHRMGERTARIVVTGSPAVDGIEAIAPLDDAAAAELGDPDVVVLLHPAGGAPADERATCAALLDAADELGLRGLLLEPNGDPGREAIVDALDVAPERHAVRRAHLSRPTFLALAARLARRPAGALLGNSSAGLIECAALGLPVLDVGTRQAGRERYGNVVHWSGAGGRSAARAALETLRAMPRPCPTVRAYGGGDAGPRIAAALANDAIDPRSACWLRKQNRY